MLKEDGRDRDRRRSLTTANSPTLPPHGKEGVVLYGLHSVTLNVDDDDDDDEKSGKTNNLQSHL